MINKREKKSEKSYELWQVTEKFGRHQIIQYFYICLATLFISMPHINYVFVAGDVNYRCRVPECEGPYSSYEAEWWPNGTIDRCTKPVVNLSLTRDTCTASSFTTLVDKCSEWVYESNDTIVAELNLACEPLKISMVGTVHNIGMLISTLVAGWACDKFGRKPALIFFCVCIIVGNLKTLASSYYVFAALELIESTLSGGTYTAGTVLMIENSGTKYRLLSGVLFAYAIYIAECIFVGIAMAVPYWKNLIHVLYTPPIICLSYIFLLKESPRWQFINGQREKALETIEHAAKINKLKIIKQDPAEIEAKLKENLNIADVEETESYRTIFTSKQILLRVFVTTVARFATSFVYYGLMINSVYLPGNKYTNFLLSTLMSFPGELIALYLMGKIGRKLPLVIGFILCGIVCIGTGYVPESVTWLKIVLFLLGKMIIAACFTGTVTYSMELFPTNARGTLLGINALSAEAGSMLAPLTPLLNNISGTLPTLFFGISAVITGLLIGLTPETKDLPLMDTVEQVEASVKHMKAKKESVKTSVNV